jgi:hypothetical protein
MRTKTLLLTAAFGAAGLATSMAQEVFSVNAVGYVNRSVPTGFSMIANPLDNSDNTVANLFDGVPDGTTVYKFDPVTSEFSINGIDFGEWANPAEELVPGEGAFIFNPGAEFEVTFVGEVMQGSLSTAVPMGFSIISSKVPQSGPLDTLLGYPAEDGDTVYRFNNATGEYSIDAFDFGEWGAGAAPEPEVGESWFMFSPSAKAWTRDFDVNNP